MMIVMCVENICCLSSTCRMFDRGIYSSGVWFCCMLVANDPVVIIVSWVFGQCLRRSGYGLTSADIVALW